MSLSPADLRRRVFVEQRSYDMYNISYFASAWHIPIASSILLSACYRRLRLLAVHPQCISSLAIGLRDICFSLRVLTAVETRATSSRWLSLGRRPREVQ